MSEHPLRGVHIAAMLGLTALFILLASAWLALPWVVSGRSMEPTLMPGDRVIVDLWSYRHRRPRVGEIVLCDCPQAPGAALVKRVAAPPLSSNVDGSRLWLLGDNPDLSDDSRLFGAVPAERVRGRVVWRYWPPGRVGAVRD